MFACSTHHRFPLYRRLQLNFLPLPPSQNIQLNFLRNLFIVNLVGGSAAERAMKLNCLQKANRIASHPIPVHNTQAHPMQQHYLDDDLQIDDDDGANNV